MRELRPADIPVIQELSEDGVKRWCADLAFANLQFHLDDTVKGMIWESFTLTDSATALLESQRLLAHKYSADPHKYSVMFSRDNPYALWTIRDFIRSRITEAGPVLEELGWDFSMEPHVVYGYPGEDFQSSLFDCHADEYPLCYIKFCLPVDRPCDFENIDTGKYNGHYRLELNGNEYESKNLHKLEMILWNQYFKAQCMQVPFHKPFKQ